MDFSQASFWFSLFIALPILYIGNKVLRQSAAFQKFFILLLSLILLGMASLLTLGIFLSVTLSAYIICKAALRCGQRGRKWILCGLIPLLFLPLVYYKYSYFLGQTLFMQNWDSLRHLIIPIGISFYTFQIVGFCIDTLLRDEPMPPFFDYLNFCAFFPQIVAGPIERREDLLPQISAPKMTLAAADLNLGIRYILLGLFFKMVLADNLAMNSAAVHAETNAWMIWTNNLLFTFRIYFDFAGYGLTAYGIARCLGITLRMNFLSPYTASDITEFWRRWHTSLTGWFRDYIYFPLGGSRTKRWALNILIVFAVSGLWHGAGWNFVIWGMFSGVAMVIHRIFRKKGYQLPSFVGWLMTFGMMVFVWMFFYITDREILLHNLQVLFSADCYGLHEYLHGMKAHNAAGALHMCGLLFSAIIIILEYLSGRFTKDPYAIFLSAPFCAAMVFFIVTCESSKESMFIYFAF